MKKFIILSFILINCIACSNGQNKNNTNSKQDLSTEILGCWKAIGAKYEIKSNYPNIDSLSLENLKLDVDSTIQKSYIAKFYKNNIMKYYKPDGTKYDQDEYYKIENDSLYIQDINSLRLHTESTSKIIISNDTLYNEMEALGEVRQAMTDVIIRDNLDFNILENIEIKTAKRYARFVRVADCDKYKEEKE